MTYQPTSAQPTASRTKHGAPSEPQTSTMHPTSQKDYAAAFGALQSQYGLGGGNLPPSPRHQFGAAPAPSRERDAHARQTRKWGNWGSSLSPSSSTTSLLRVGSGSHSRGEAQLGEMMAEYGCGSGSRGVPFHRGK